MNGADVNAIARASVARLRLQVADRDDAAQEAAIGILRADRLDRTRPADEQRGYLFVVGRSRALDYLRRRARSIGHEACPEAAPEPVAADPTPEAQFIASEPGAALVAFADYVAAGHEPTANAVRNAMLAAPLSGQERALLRYKLGMEEMREDLEKLKKGGRGSVSNRARKKLAAAAVEFGVEDVLTPDILKALFGSAGDR